VSRQARNKGWSWREAYEADGNKNSIKEVAQRLLTQFATRCTTFQGGLVVISTSTSGHVGHSGYFDYVHLPANMLCFCFRALPKLRVRAARSRTPVSLSGTERRSPRKGAGSDMAADSVAVAPFTALHKQTQVEGSGDCEPPTVKKTHGVAITTRGPR
jgi:hypothetical protein